MKQHRGAVAFMVVPVSWTLMLHQRYQISETGRMWPFVTYGNLCSRRFSAL